MHKENGRGTNQQILSLISICFKNTPLESDFSFLFSILFSSYQYDRSSSYYIYEIIIYMKFNFHFSFYHLDDLISFQAMTQQGLKSASIPSQVYRARIGEIKITSTLSNRDSCFDKSPTLDVSVLIQTCFCVLVYVLQGSGLSCIRRTFMISNAMSQPDNFSKTPQEIRCVLGNPFCNGIAK